MRIKIKHSLYSKAALFLLLFLALCIVFLFLCAPFSPLFPRGDFSGFRAAVSLNDLNRNADSRKIVVLDAGHGGYDGGAKSAAGTLEKDLNLSLTHKIAAFLSLYNVDVILTRSADTPPDLVEDSSRKRTEILSRAKIANDVNADVFLSIHMNSFPSANCSGSQAFYSLKNTSNERLARTLQEAIQTLLQPENLRSAKETDLIFLLSHVQSPAALLECGFLSNAQEASLLQDENYQSKLAFCIAGAIISFLNQT